MVCSSEILTASLGFAVSLRFAFEPQPNPLRRTAASDGARSSTSPPISRSRSCPPQSRFALDALPFAIAGTLYRADPRASSHAAEDRSTSSALVLHIDELDWGWAKLAEVRDAVLDFRSSGKPVYASLSGGGEREYFLASAADLIAMPPPGDAPARRAHRLRALHARHLRQARHPTRTSPTSGTYKSGGRELHARRACRRPTREALESLLDDEYRCLVDSLATARGMRSRLDRRRCSTRARSSAQEALELGLIDTLLYDADVDSLALADDRRGRADDAPLLALRRRTLAPARDRASR